MSFAYSSTIEDIASNLELATGELAGVKHVVGIEPVFVVQASDRFALQHRRNSSLELGVIPDTRKGF